MNSVLEGEVQPPVLVPAQTEVAVVDDSPRGVGEEEQEGQATGHGVD